MGLGNFEGTHSKSLPIHSFTGQRQVVGTSRSPIYPPRSLANQNRFWRADRGNDVKKPHNGCWIKKASTALERTSTPLE
jgi:hypothetical protein